MIPEYLLGGKNCERAICMGCDVAVKISPSGRWFITMGHPGFNSRANNLNGYATKAKAEAAVRRYGQQPNPAIKARYDSLRRMSKDDLIHRYPSRLDMSHLRSEAKAVIVSAILEAEFGGRALQQWNGK